jgi:hypothetical protein
MNLEERLLKAEAALAIGMPLSLNECLKWFAMFMETNGTGYATPHPNFSEADWKWFEEHTEDALRSLEILQSRKFSHS